MSCNQSTAWISFGIGTFVNIALFFTQFAYSTYTDDIFEITDEKSSKKPNRPTRGFQVEIVSKELNHLAAILHVYGV